jgi:4,5-dihydroxyphthalate decarboxylase
MAQSMPTLAKLPKLGLPLRVAFSDYDRTRPLVDGSVPMRGIAPTFTLDDIGQFCIRPVYEEFDVAEMSFSWYVMARDRGEPVIALPIFPLRMPVLSYLFCRSDAPFRTPADLKGGRVATEAYRLTVNLWLRGICNEHYGLAPHDVEWFSSFKEEGAGFVIPKSVRVTLDAGDAEELLLAGKVDAVFSPTIPRRFGAGDPAIRRFFTDHEAEHAAYYRKTKIVPITHVMVVGEALLEREPWIVSSLLDAFRAAQAAVDEAYREPKFLSFPGALGALEAQRALLGPTLYTHGLEGNRHVLETFVRYAHEQGYIKRRLDVDGLFAPV